MSPDRIERVLHIHLGTVEEPQSSLCNALASLSTPGGYCRIDWPALPTLPQRHRAVVDAVATFKPTLIFMQLQRPNVLTPSTLAEVRKVCRANHPVIATWCGDVGDYNGPFRTQNDRWAYELSPYCDLMLYSSMSQVRAHRSRGMHNAAYLQIGYDEHRFFEGPDDHYGARFDVVFLGTKYEEHRWLSIPANDVRLRTIAVTELRSKLGGRLGLFGAHWSGGCSPLASALSGDAYRAAHMALSVSVCSNLERYSSDRLFRSLACGAAVLMKRFSDWGSFGLEHERNVLAWDSSSELLALVNEWLDERRAPGLRKIGLAGAKLAREHHSWGCRILEFYPLIVAARGGCPEVTRPW